MTPRTIVRPLADTDLLEIYAYLAPRNLTAADRFLTAVAADFDRLATTPGMGSLRPTRNPALRTLRSWPVGGFRNYIIFYLPNSDGIEVVRILHAARDPDRILAEP